MVEPEADATSGEGDPAGDKPKRRRGRRCNLHKVIGEERIEIPDPIYESQFERIGAEAETAKLRWRRGGLVRVVIARLKYRTAPGTANENLSAADVSSVISATEVAVASAPMTAPENATSSTIEVPDVDATPSASASPVEVPPTQLAISTATSAATPPEVAAVVPSAPAIAVKAGDSIPARPTIVTARMPPQLLPGSYATASLLAHIASDKFCDGLPLHRQEDRFARLGVTIILSPVGA